SAVTIPDSSQPPSVDLELAPAWTGLTAMKRPKQRRPLSRQALGLIIGLVARALLLALAAHVLWAPSSIATASRNRRRTSRSRRNPCGLWRTHHVWFVRIWGSRSRGQSMEPRHVLSSEDPVHVGSSRSLTTSPHCSHRKAINSENPEAICTAPEY